MAWGQLWGPVLSPRVGGGGRGLRVRESGRGLRGSESWSQGLGARPGDIVDEVCLQQKLAAREQVLSDEVLVGAHGHAIAHTQGTQHIQHLEVKVRGQGVRAPERWGGGSMEDPGWEIKIWTEKR